MNCLIFIMNRFNLDNVILKKNMLKKMFINLFCLFIIFEYSTAEDTNIDQEPINKIRLGSKFKVECHANVTNEFMFDRLIFNRSLSLPSESSKRFMKINSYVEFNTIFYLIDKQWNTNKVYIEQAKFSHSGQYYCVYSARKDDHIEYLVESYLFLVHDGNFFKIKIIKF